MMFADIASGEVDWADILFLIAAILAGVAAVIAWGDRTLKDVLGWGAVCAVAVGFLLL